MDTTLLVVKALNRRRVHILLLYVMTLSVLIAFPPVVFAQSVATRGWIDVNFIGLRSQQSERVYSNTEEVFGETAMASAQYPALPVATGGNFAAGVQFPKGLGVGVHAGLVTYESAVGMAVRLPHPLFFNRFATDAAVTERGLERKDRAVDIEVAYTLPTPSTWRVRVFGGPTRFKVSQEMVSEIAVDQIVSLVGDNFVAITGHTEEEVTGSAWGFNLGTDVSYFFSKHVGVGGVVRFNRGEVSIDEPFTGKAERLNAGQTTFGGGLRLRF